MVDTNKKAELFLEKLKASDDMDVWIKDFYKSDAPQFKGKSKAKRRQMAVAAKLDAMDEGLEEAQKPQLPKWKRAGPDGEREIKFPTGRRFKIEKQYDENIRHKGEWKVMEWDTRSKDWEWGETYSPKAYAKQKAMEAGQYDTRGKKVADYSKTFKFESIEESAKTEDAPINSVGGGNIAGLGVGAQGEPGLTKKQQKKYKKKNIMRFKDYTTEDGPCWDSHKQVGMKKSKRTNKMVPNCVPK